MNQNYDWNNPTFRNRCGESLNLAVNLIADVLHAFYVKEVIPEFPSSIILLPLMVLIMLISVYVKKATLRKAKT